MTDKEVILNFIDECYCDLHRIDCSNLSTDDCEMLRLYIAENPKSYMFGKMYGVFEHDGILYKFLWHIHEPNQKFASLSNRMTEFQMLVIQTSHSGFKFITTRPAENGHRAFWLNTPNSYLDGFDLSLRKLMHSIKTYAVSEQLCKRIRKYDKHHLAWREEMNKKSQL